MHNRGEEKSLVYLFLKEIDSRAWLTNERNEWRTKTDNQREAHLFRRVPANIFDTICILFALHAVRARGE